MPVTMNVYGGSKTLARHDLQLKIIIFLIIINHNEATDSWLSFWCSMGAGNEICISGRIKLT